MIGDTKKTMRPEAGIATAAATHHLDGIAAATAPAHLTTHLQTPTIVARGPARQPIGATDVHLLETSVDESTTIGMRRGITKENSATRIGNETEIENNATVVRHRGTSYWKD